MPGRLRTVKRGGKTYLVYHRGHGKYQVYDLGLDKKRKAKTVPKRPGYGHTGDYKPRKSKKSKSKRKTKKSKSKSKRKTKKTKKKSKK